VTRRIPHNPGSWPRLMRAPTAAAYVDEASVESFLRGVGTLYPLPVKLPGKGDRWLKEDLDVAIESATLPTCYEARILASLYAGEAP
jgi:hypothetical protein